MRQRRVKNEEERLSANAEYIVEDGERFRGKWGQVFPECGKIFLEFGCGRGKFITTLAEKNPTNNYVGIEARSSVVLRALEKSKEKELKNTLFLIDMVNDIELYFAENELDGLYLNFSDPWPKIRHAKRRLTHRGYLASYRRILKPGSFLEFKTDNDALFEFSLNEMEECGLVILEHTRDLHSSLLKAKDITTEYEEKFRLLNEKINYCKVAF